MEEELKELEKKAILQVSTWWGLRSPGYSGVIITKDRELYTYQFYHQIPKEFDGKIVNCVTKKRDLSDKEFKEITTFIETEVLPKEYESYRIFDVGYDVIVNYNGINKVVKNNKDDSGNNMGLYDKAKKIVDDLIEKIN